LTESSPGWHRRLSVDARHKAHKAGHDRRRPRRPPEAGRLFYRQLRLHRALTTHIVMSHFYIEREVAAESRHVGEGVETDVAHIRFIEEYVHVLSRHNPCVQGGAMLGVSSG
jgi:hypothetical protein